MNRYCAFGNPIGHSKLLLIHRLFAGQTDEALVYNTQLVSLDDFPGFARRFFEQGKDADVTVPFREEAHRPVDELNERATRIGAVGTLIHLADGRLRGGNTDDAGLLRDLAANVGVELRGERILLLNVNGAVRGMLRPFLGECPAELLIVNRTAREAVDLAKRFVDPGTVCDCSFAEVEEPLDLVVNDTSVSLAGDVLPLAQSVIEPGRTIRYDMMYAKEPTAFDRWTAERDAVRVLGGLGMLVKQAAKAFFLWRGVRPASALVLKTLRR